ncbi:MAG TPA: hypothetical protein VFU13_04925 [Steroidobacteraceae bacterium]|nr:hypothetical protein [Steroidobacteraceae bacterium]
MRIGEWNFKTLAGFVVLCASPVALAWDGYPSGVPGLIQVTHGDNYGFRVQFSPAVPMCGNDNHWAYLNSTDSNYSTYVAVIMMAKSQGQPVMVYSNRDTNGYCRIGHLAQP